jgi:hypothetical protein
MFYKITEKVDNVFQDYDVMTMCSIGQDRNVYKIHKKWLEVAHKTGMVKNYTITDDSVEIEFSDSLELYKPYYKTITKLGGEYVGNSLRGVEIQYLPSTDELYMRGYDGWGLDLSELTGDYLDEYLNAMAEIKEIKSKIKL